MEGAPAKDLAEETDPMMMEEKKDEMMEEKKSEKSGSAKTAKHSDNLEPCCCCLCVCSNNLTENLTCFGCCPIKCGVILIGMLTVILTCILCTYNIFFILNDYVAWYFPVVVLVLLIPLVIASFFFVVFFSKDTVSSRGKLGSACILALISIVLSGIWTTVYFIWLYKKDAIYTGAGSPEYGQGYHKTNKKVYIWTIIAETIVLSALYVYFIMACGSYHTAMKESK